MTSAATESLAALVTKAAASGEVPNGWEASLAERLRGLLRSRDSDLKGAATVLRTHFQELLRRVEPDLRDELLARAAPATTKARAAYLLGQMSVAHLIIAQEASRRPDEEFRKAMNDPQYLVLIAEMYRADEWTYSLESSGSAIFTALGAMRRLGQSGVCDHRHVGRRPYFFLTPAARQEFRRSLECEALELNQPWQVATRATPSRAWLLDAPTPTLPVGSLAQWLIDHYPSGVGNFGPPQPRRVYPMTPEGRASQARQLAATLSDKPGAASAVADLLGYSMRLTEFGQHVQLQLAELRAQRDSATEAGAAAAWQKRLSEMEVHFNLNTSSDDGEITP